MVQGDNMGRPEVRHPEPPAGEWLFKLHYEILGPVPSSDIIEKMFTGEVDESTEISLAEGEWSTVQAVGTFHPFLYQAKAQIRARQAKLEAERAARKRKIRNMINVAIGAMILVIMSFVASYLVIVNRPWKGEDVLRAWASKHVPLLGMPAAKAGTMRGEASKETANTGGINIDQILIDDAPALVAIKAPSRSKKRKRVDRKKTSPGKSKETGAKTKPDEPKETATASVGRLSNEEITDVVYSRSNLRRLYACIQKEIRKNPDLPGTIILEFTINNDGRINQVRMDNIKLEGSSMHKCFRQKLTAVKFRPFAGQVRNVTMPFNINK